MTKGTLRALGPLSGSPPPLLPRVCLLFLRGAPERRAFSPGRANVALSAAARAAAVLLRVVLAIAFDKTELDATPRETRAVRRRHAAPCCTVPWNDNRERRLITRR